MSQLGGYGQMISPFSVEMGTAPGWEGQAAVAPAQRPQMQQQQTAASPTRGGKVPAQLRPTGYQNPAEQGVPGYNPGSLIGRIQDVTDVTPPQSSAALASYLGRGTGASVDPNAALKQYLLQQVSQPARQYNGQAETTRSFDNPALAQYLADGRVAPGNLLMTETTRQAPPAMTYDKILAQMMPMMPVAYTPADQMEQARVAAPIQAQAALAYQHYLQNQQQTAMGLNQQDLQKQQLLGDLGIRQMQAQGQLALGQREMDLRQQEMNQKYTPAGRLGQYEQFLLSQPGLTPEQAASQVQRAVRAGLFQGSIGSPSVAGGNALAQAIGANSQPLGLGNNSYGGSQGLLPPPGMPAGHSFAPIEHELDEARADPNGKIRTIGEFLWNLNNTKPPGYVQQNWPSIKQYIVNRFGNQDYQRAKADPSTIAGAYQLGGGALGGATNAIRLLFGKAFDPNASIDNVLIGQHTDDQMGRSALRRLLEGQ